MDKQSAHAIQELEKLHATLVELENQGNHKLARLRWAVGWVMDEVVTSAERCDD